MVADDREGIQLLIHDHKTVILLRAVILGSDLENHAERIVLAVGMLEGIEHAALTQSYDIGGVGSLDQVLTGAHRHVVVRMVCCRRKIKRPAAVRIKRCDSALGIGVDDCETEHLILVAERRIRG